MALFHLRLLPQRSSHLQQGLAIGLRRLMLAAPAVLLGIGSSEANRRCGKITGQANFSITPYFSPIDAAYISHHKTAAVRIAPHPEQSQM
jgi:hypothetical protein